MPRVVFCLACAIGHVACASAGHSEIGDVAQMVNNVRRGEMARPHVDTFRIYEPATDWSYAHGARLAKFKGRFYTMFANCQKDEGQCGSRVLISESDDGVAWTVPHVLLPPQQGKSSDLALFAGGFIEADGKLYAYTFGGEYPADRLRGPNVRPLKDGFASRSAWMFATEDGRTWTGPTPIPYWIIRPCRTPSGKWIGMGPPYYPWTTTPGDPTSWKKAPIDMKRLASFSPTPKLVTESHLCPGSDGVLRLFHRTELGNIWMSESQNDGASWMTPKPTSFAHDNSMFAFGVLPDGRTFVVGNPVGDHMRTPLVLMTSRNGVDFDDWYLIRDTPVQRRFEGLYKGGLYGYPEAVVADGFLHVVYSVNKEAIDISRVALADIKPLSSHVIAEGEFIAPPVTGHVHASTIVPLKGTGGYLAAWFEGSKESAKDVAIRGTRRIGGKWEPVRTFAKVNPESPHWNPVLRRADDGRIELFFKVGRNCADWRTYVQESRDDGVTWSASRELVPGDVWGGRGPVKNKCLKLKSGRWLAPASREFDTSAQWKLETLWRAFVDISDDDGRTWRASPPFPVPSDAPVWGKRPFGVIQPTLWEDEKGVHAMMRATDGWIWRTDSTDGGETWNECRRTSLENINSGLDCVRASDGRLYLAMNGRGDGKGWGTRNHLEVKVSDDGGETWKTFAVLADDPLMHVGRKTEFSYPAVIEPRPGVLAITFTWNRRQIRFVEIRLP